MRKEEFREWLTKKGVDKKQIGDCISRLKRIEREFDHCDIDMHFDKDRCEFILSTFSKSGNNESMKKYPNADFPIGKRHLLSYRSALRKYIAFRDESTSSKKK